MKWKLSSYLLGLSCLLTPVFCSACNSKTNDLNIQENKLAQNKQSESLNLLFSNESINILANECYQSKEILAKYKNDYHECDFEIIDPLSWMSIKNNCFCIDNSNKEGGTYHPLIVAKSKAIEGLHSLPKQLTVNIEKPKIDKITWTNYQNEYLAIAGDDYQICPIKLDFDSSLSLEEILKRIKINVYVIGNISVDTNGNDLFYVKLIGNKFYLYISEYSYSSYINYTNNFQLEIEIVDINTQDQQVYLRKTFNVNVIDGLKYKEDGIVYSRKTAKDNWTIESIGSTVEKINLPEPKLIYNHLVDKVGEDAARNHDNLASIQINYPFDEIGKCGFYNCKNLKSVKITANKIADFAFWGCKEIRDSKIDIFESIGQYAFKNCPNLTNSITLGESFKYFYANAFEQSDIGEKNIRYYGVLLRTYTFILNVTSSTPPIVYGDLPLINGNSNLFAVSLPDDIDIDTFYYGYLKSTEENRDDLTWWTTLLNNRKIWTRQYRIRQQMAEWMALESQTDFFRHLRNN